MVLGWKSSIDTTIEVEPNPSNHSEQIPAQFQYLPTLIVEEAIKFG
jgi:hypothetical protein